MVAISHTARKRLERLTPAASVKSEPCVVHVDALSIRTIQTLRFWKWAAQAAGHRTIPTVQAWDVPVEDFEPTPIEPIAWQDLRTPQASPSRSPSAFASPAKPLSVPSRFSPTVCLSAKSAAWRPTTPSSGRGRLTR